MCRGFVSFIRNLSKMTQAPSDQASGISRSRPVVLPEVFNGDGQFNEWVSHFESVAAVNRWGDEDKLLWL